MRLTHLVLAVAFALAATSTASITASATTATTLTTEDTKASARELTDFTSDLEERGKSGGGGRGGSARSRVYGNAGEAVNPFGTVGNALKDFKSWWGKVFNVNKKATRRLRL